MKLRSPFLSAFLPGLLPLLTLLTAAPIVCADAQSDVQAAIKKLAGEANSSWVSTPTTEPFDRV